MSVVCYWWLFVKVEPRLLVSSCLNISVAELAGSGLSPIG